MESKFALYDSTIKHATTLFLGNEYDWRVYKSMLFIESGLDPLAVSPTGAVGLAQFLSNTWDEWAPKAGYEGDERTEPEASIMVGAAYLADRISKWTSPRPEIDRICLGLLSYNAGFRHVLTAQEIAEGSVLYKDIVGSLHKVPGLSDDRIRDGQRYAKKIYLCYFEDVLG